MIIRAEVDFKELLRLGKEYLWPRPAGCPNCGHGVWGHGYVPRYFKAVSGICWCKRYRCPKCKTIITMRPAGYWPRFYHPEAEIYVGLKHRMETQLWPPGLGRQAGGHWWRGLSLQVRKYLGLVAKLFPEGFAGVMKLGWVPVSRSKIGVALPQGC